MKIIKLLTGFFCILLIIVSSGCKYFEKINYDVHIKSPQKNTVVDRVIKISYSLPKNPEKYFDEKIFVGKNEGVYNAGHRDVFQVVNEKSMKHLIILDKSYSGKVWIGIQVKTKNDKSIHRSKKVCVNIKKKSREKENKLVLVEGGTFKMGSGHPPGAKWSEPIHEVKVDTFYIGKYEITLGQYLRYLKATKDEQGIAWEWRDKSNENVFFEKEGGSYFLSGNRCGKLKDQPVFCSWFAAARYCNWLSKQEKLTPCYSIKGKNVECNFEANGYRLPTEAEWEFAARGGNKSNGYMYSGSNDLREVAWFKECLETCPVGTKKPNELGLHDMSGNVSEWCWDWFDENYYNTSPRVNPKGPSSGKYKSIRGGDFYQAEKLPPIMIRSRAPRNWDRAFIGFRVVKRPE